MRHLAVPLALVVLSACPENTFSNPPPASRFFYPSGVAHVDAPGTTNGYLFVTNANWNKLYESGSVAAVKLDEVGLPPFGAAVDGGPLELTSLGNATSIQVNSFGGELGALALAPGKLRLFVPSRSEGMKFQAVDALFLDGGLELSCFPAAPADRPRDCGANAPSMSPAAFEQAPGGVPRAVAPFGVGVQRRACASDDVCGAGRTCGADGGCLTGAGEAFADTWVTHLFQADSPIASGLNYRGYVVRVESDTMAAPAENFVNMGLGATSSVATGKHWAYVTGRFVNATTYPLPVMLRMVQYSPQQLVGTAGLELTFAAQDARGVALSSDESRLYLLARSPDTLLVVGLSNLDGALPSVRLLRSVPLPFLPNEVVTIPRAGRGDLLAITCSGSGVLAIYDEDLGEVAAQVTAVGAQPFGIAVDRRGAGARLFVSDFADGRVAVVEIPDLTRPQEARTVAHLGKRQACLTQVTPIAGCATETP